MDDPEVQRNMRKVRDESVEDIKAMAEGRLEESQKKKEDYNTKADMAKISQSSMDSLEKIKDAFEKCAEPSKDLKANESKETWVAIIIAMCLLVLYIAIQVITMRNKNPVTDADK